MATKIRRCLFIGLGGTGMTALLHTKKAFIETYGEIPPMIGFLGLDTDGGAYKKYLDSSYGPVMLNPNEQKAISVKSAYDIYQVQRQHFDWVPDEAKFALSNLSSTGAGQIRSNGRFSLINNISDVQDAISQKIGDITDIRMAIDEKYELLSDNVEIHMVFSLCGGTGAGTFIDTAYLIRRLTNYEAKLAGYAVLPDVFLEMKTTGMERVRPNAFGALVELDRLMHFGLNDQLDFNYGGRLIPINRRPFNAVFVIDNKNNSGDTVKDVAQLAEMISAALTTAAGELSAATASTLDNIEQSIAQGNYEIGDKKGWVSSLGASEIVFSGHSLAKILALKTAQSIITRLLNTCEDANNIANAWIDSPEVNIRENNGPENDNVIDFILPEKLPTILLTGIENKQNAMVEIDNYIKENGQPKAEELESKRKALENRVYPELTKFINDLLNSECGVGKAENTLKELSTLINLFSDEMVQEKQELSSKLKVIDSSVKAAADELRDESGRFLSGLFGSRVRDREENLVSIVMEKTKILREIARREQATIFFNGLKNRINKEKEKVDNIKSQLNAVSEILRTRVATIQNHINGSNETFRIDLAKDYANVIAVNDNTLNISDFVRHSGGEIINNFANLSVDEIYQKLIKYAIERQDVKNWANMTVEEVLNDIYKKDPNRFSIILKKALHKSNPMLQENTRGHAFKDGMKMAELYYIGVQDKDNTIIRNCGIIDNLIPQGNRAEIASIGMTDRIIFYHQRGTMPLFFIGPILSYKSIYDDKPGLYHIDEKLRRRMEREGYSIMPAAEIDDTLELWVKGLIFGKIKKENGTYMYQNEAEGEGIFDYWMPLAECRDDAYDAFKRNVSKIRNSYNDAFEQEKSRRGEDQIRALVDDLKANYREKYSQCDLTNADLMKKGNEAVRKLLNEELEYIRMI